MAAIELEGVGKRFNEVAVVDGIDLRIAEGEFFTFVGPSGCGKSTLLGLIAGLDRPTSGALRFDGMVVNEVPAQARDVAMVFQSYALYPHMTVAENIGFPLKLRGAPRRTIADAVERIAQSLGLTPLLARRPRELSGGQRQRVALGRALVRRPRVFLLDEPLSNLDARLRLEMRAELKRLHAENGITTIYVTHDQEEAMALSDRVAVLRSGRIQQCDVPMRVYQDPQNLFVAGFIGSPPINVLDAALLNGEATDNVVVGIRPADVRVAAIQRDGAASGNVVVCEPTGSDTWVMLDWRGQRLLGRAHPGERLAPGAPAYFELPSERMYRFDKATGARLR